MAFTDDDINLIDVLDFICFEQAFYTFQQAFFSYWNHHHAAGLFRHTGLDRLIDRQRDGQFLDTKIFIIQHPGTITADGA